VIVVCGEALIDLTPARCGGEDGFVPRPGGSPFNVAVGLARLDVPTAFVGRLSDDRFGRMLRTRLETEGVDLRAVAVGPEPTPLAVVHVDDSGHPTYSFHWEGTADRHLRAADLPARLPDAVRAIHVGSVSLSLEPGASTIARLVERERPTRVICLDPNVRPGVVGDDEGYRARLREWVRRADVVKVSDEDLAWLAPGVAPREAARRWLDQGAHLVVVTRGRDGAVGMTGAVEVAVTAPAVEVADTVGAGDAFSAGMLAALGERDLLERTGLSRLDADELRAVLCFAVAVAASTCQRSGADPPRRSEVAAP
jgi:fructokinase